MAIYDVNGNEISGTTDLYESAKRLGVHLMPNSLGELNAVKRARQMTDIKWTPCVNRHKGGYVEYDASADVTQRFDDTFLAGTEYTGIPYSRGDARASYGMPLYGYERGFVGYDVPISAFVTSAINPHSYFSTSSYYSMGANAGYTPYGVTCDTLVCYALAFSQWYGSDAGFQSLVNNGTLVYVCDSDDIQNYASSIHLGDVLFKKGVHVAIITDVVIDDNGNLFIEVSEATTKGATTPDLIGGQKGGLSRRELWGMDVFFTRFSGYKIYRYVNVDTITYEQIRYVTLEGESPMHNLQDRIPLMPFMGDGFIYKVGYIPNDTVVLGTSSYAYMAVYKDNELFNIFTVNSSTSISVGFTAVGDYSAFLFNSSDGTVANMTARTVACTWSVVSA